jgi:hypothetical protein
MVRGAGLGGLLALLGGGALAQDTDPAVGEFATRLAAALAGTAADYDRLWVPGARDSTGRRLDVRKSALFRWKQVTVEVESAKRVSRAEGTEYVVDLVVRGQAQWTPRAYGIATAFWTLMTDEEDETNDIVRRESWRLAATDAGFRAVERVLLSPVEVVWAQIEVGVYPGQDAVLVECAYYLRSRTDGVEHLRFLLDRRAEVYDLRVDGVQARVVRGNELGSFGLEGFSPEVESSLRFPAPLMAGEEALVKFKIRSPLVHLRGDGFVTTLAFREGPFQERAWYPILGPESCATEPGRADVQLAVRWPGETFDSFALAGSAVPSPDEREEDVLNEEERHRTTIAGTRAADFALGFAGTSLSDLAWLDPDRRARRALVDPLLSAAIYSSEDLESAIEELLPLEEDLLDIFLDDDAGGDSEEGADDRTSG